MSQKKEEGGKTYDFKGIVLKALATEKAIRLIEKENTLTFLVDLRATKREIAEEVEKMLGVKVERVNTLVTPRGEKKAYVKLSKDYKATDVAHKLGIL
ncbi:MAG: 50S ribosomal protein L23 [Thermoprotei archaeon]